MNTAMAAPKDNLAAALRLLGVGPRQSTEPRHISIAGRELLDALLGTAEHHAAAWAEELAYRSKARVIARAALSALESSAGAAHVMDELRVLRDTVLVPAYPYPVNRHRLVNAIAATAQLGA